MSTSRSPNLIRLTAVFVVCWVISTVVLTFGVDWSIWVELRPGYRMIKDEASWPMRVLLAMLFGAIQSGVVVGLLALWRRVSRAHDNEA